MQGGVRRRSGFTLIEMMAVLAIILLLAGMVFLGLQKGLYSARNRAVISEMKLIEGAFMRYKEQHLNQLPPCMGDATLTTSGAVNVNGVTRQGRQNRFFYHVRLAYPESRWNGVYGNYGNMRSFILYNYNVVVNGTVVQLDLNNMDQAEALVFWLGGFPTPVPPSNPSAGAQPLANRKLFGFNRQSVSPFQLEVPAGNSGDLAMQTRWLPWEHYGFDFDESRLQDADLDGWLEYVPPIGPYTDRTQTLPPYVYFDYDVYNIGQWGMNVASSVLGYPTPGLGFNTPATSQMLVSEWGLAVPSAASVDTSNTASPIQWINPAGLQIISAGQDFQYSDPANNPSNFATPRIPTYPSGDVITPGSGTAPLDVFERDNLTNYSNGTLGDDATAAGS